MSKIFSLAAVAVLAALCGCVSPRTSGVVVEKGRIVFEDPAFAANIEVLQDVRERTQEGFLHAQVTLQNTNRTDYECQYRFEWRGANGVMQKHAPTPWRPILLHGREPVELDAVSPLPDTDDFRLVIRRR